MNRLISNAPYGSHTNTVPETEEYWTNAIIGIRGNVPDQRFSRSIEEEVDLAVAFAQCFGGRWKLPMAVFCFTLLPRDETDTDLLKIFSRLQLTDADREACFATGTKITRPANLPELAQFHRFMQVYYLGHCANKINEYIAQAKTAIGNAMTVIEGMQRLGHGSTPSFMVGKFDEFWTMLLKTEQAIVQLKSNLREQLGGIKRLVNTNRANCAD